MFFNKKNNNIKKYAKIKKRNYRKEFYEKDLAQIYRNVQWQDTYYTIDKDETVLLQCRYRIHATDDKDWYGLRDFHFYVVEKNGKKYSKLINLTKLDEGGFDWGIDCYDYFGFVDAVNRHEVEIFTPSYRKRLIKNTEIIELDENFSKVLDSAKNIDFDKSYMDLFTCKFNMSDVQFDCYDFYNKHVFIADGYCLKKYEPYIKIINYIFEQSNYKYLNPSPIKIKDTLDDAYKEMVEKKDEEDEFDGMIR